MQHQWYYFRDGRQHGPVSTAELERMIKYDRLKQTDHVRIVESDDWIPVAEIMAMFSGRDGSGMSAAESAARLLSPTGHMSPRHDENDDSGPGVIDSLLTGSRRLVSDSVVTGGNLLSDGMERLTQFVSLRNGITTAIALIVVALAFAFKDVEFGNSETQHAIDQMQTIYDELDQVQGRNTSSSDWTAFQAEALAVLEPLQKKLEDRDRRNPRLRSHYWMESGFRQSVARSHLIQAGQVLRKMVIAHGGDDSLRAHLHRRLDSADAQLKFDPVTNSGRGSWVDPMTAGIVFVDVLLAIGGGIYWWKRSRS